MPPPQPAHKDNFVRSLCRLEKLLQMEQTEAS